MLTIADFSRKIIYDLNKTFPNAYFGDIRTPIPGTSGQHNGIIRTAFRWHTDILSSL